MLALHIVSLRKIVTQRRKKQLWISLTLLLVVAHTDDGGNNRRAMLLISPVKCPIDSVPHDHGVRERSMYCTGIELKYVLHLPWRIAAATCSMKCFAALSLRPASGACSSQPEEVCVYHYPRI